MNGHIFYSTGHTDALKYAKETLLSKGCEFSEAPGSSVTHLLLGVPSFDADGNLKGGGSIEGILRQLPQDVTVLGGNLNHPALSERKTIDLLQDPIYLAANADITAHCALRIAMMELPITLRGCHVLVVGWGRIGKCLSTLLKQLGAIVTVAARKESDRAMLQALDFDTEDIHALGYSLVRYRIIFNTVPVMVLPQDSLQYCHADCLKIDLASAPGMEGTDVKWARGLPGKYTPESSGKLIARTVLRLCRGTS